MTSRSTPFPEVPVWDIWVRLFHWGLVATVALSALTGFFGDARWLAVHLASGGTAAALVLARIVWGVFGGGHARFADFVPRPRALLSHVIGQDHRHRGHNPVGALMVLAVFVAILALAITGLVILGGWLRLGPLAADLGTGAGHAARELHEAVALGVAVLVLMHLGGVLYESRRSDENLARAMVTGLKEARPGDIEPDGVRPRAGRAVKTIAAMAAMLLSGGLILSMRPVPNQPVAAIDPLTAEECGACHMVFHPSLLPARSWQQLMAGLDTHFGENAWIDAGDAAEIEAWLTANAAETVDTAPARIFAQPAPEAPFTLTETPAWQRLHGTLPEALFNRAPIFTRANCAACHADAETGRFSPFAISIPKETTR
ncbi:Ni,Fe-hydrogenase I cytochrome b subunit [Rhodovulum sp. P5]|uniref:cytochrome b/b6 domain-containing protein n=1 Tax=Rhodovulum sp. P5 TaxID=1564506 RepID=UPI0009C1B407|nr:cytochrome b/b6 domain-containing protein [Rhodovulum sp. P5]ARE39716.1 Ni,Fe-hydrogenase I cytochrome b subunit [Rhodovulum sp. P5]